MPATVLAAVVRASEEVTVDEPTGFFGALANAADWFIGLFEAGGEVFMGLVTGIIPTLVVLLTAVNALIRLIGPEKIDRLGAAAGRPGLQWYPVRYLVLPVLSVFFLTNPMAYTMGRFLPERYKPAFYDSAVSFVHPITGIFPHANPGELFVYLGIAGGVAALGLNTSDLAVRYLLVGMVVILIRGIVTELIYRADDDPSRRPAAGGCSMSTTAPQKTSGVDRASKLLVTVGKGAGKVVGTLYQAGRDAIDTIIRNILPFMAFIAVLIGIITETGLGDWLAHLIEPLAGSLIGLLAISIFCSIPILSPVLGPGAVIAQVVGVLIGTRIAEGDIAPQYALPALFAIDPQVGCDFIPVGLALGEAEPETVEVGVPAVLISRMFTGPLSVVIAYLASFGLYTSST